MTIKRKHFIVVRNKSKRRGVSSEYTVRFGGIIIERSEQLEPLENFITQKLAQFKADGIPEGLNQQIEKELIT